LKFLTEFNSENFSQYNKGLHELYDDLIGIDPYSIRTALGILKNEKLIDYSEDINEKITLIHLTHNGLDYFNKKSEVMRQKWSDRRWMLFQILLGYVFGFASGLALAWISFNYFKK